VIALGDVAPERSEQLPGLPVLDPLADDLEAEVVTKRDRRPHDRLAAVVGRHRDDELAVDLHRVDRQCGEVAERRVPGAEVVDGDDEAEAPDLLDRREDPVGLVHERALGDLELEPLGSHPVAVEERGEPIREQPILHRLHGDVHRDAQVGDPPAPRGQEPAGLAEDLERERRGRAALFGERNERRRSDLAPNGVPPAGQRLEPNDLPAAEVHQGLQRDAHVALGQGLLEVHRCERSVGRQHGPSHTRRSLARGPAFDGAGSQMGLSQAGFAPRPRRCHHERTAAGASGTAP
jgi:hypothetical protein